MSNNYLCEDTCNVFKNSKDFDIEVTNKHVQCSLEEKREIDICWEKELKRNPKLFNGQVYSIDSISINIEKIYIKLNTTNYAHYTYVMNNINHDITMCRSIAIGGLILTRDNYLVLGKMGENTSFPGIIQCIGGGIDKKDVENNFLDPKNTLIREFEEELGYKLLEKNLDLSSSYIYLRKKHSTFGICYIFQIDESIEQFKKIFHHFKDSNMYDGEIENLVFFEKNNKSIKNFLESNKNRVDYIKDILLDTINYKKVEKFTYNYSTFPAEITENK